MDLLLRVPLFFVGRASPPLLGSLLFCIIGSGAVSPEAFPALGKGVLAAAQFAEDVGDATGTAANVGASIRAAAADVVVSVATGSLSTFREAYNGVDLLGVNLQVERGTVLVDELAEAADFTDSDLGVQWIRAPHELRHEVAEIIRALSPQTMWGSLTRHRLNASGSYLELQMSTEYLENGYVGIEWNVVYAFVQFAGQTPCGNCPVGVQKPKLQQ